MKKKYSTILFDADNTIFNFDKDEDCAIRATFKDLNLKITEDNISMYKSINKGLWKDFEKGKITKDDIKNTRFRILCEKLGVDCPLPPIEMNGCYSNHLGDGGNLLDGARELCESLFEAGYEMYLITNGIEKTQFSRLENSGVKTFFKKVFVSESVGFQKPDKRYFDFVLCNIDEKEKEKILVVGDTLSSDILGANNAGLDSIWLNMKNEKIADGMKAEYIVSSLSQIADLLLAKKATALSKA